MQQVIHNKTQDITDVQESLGELQLEFVQMFSDI